MRHFTSKPITAGSAAAQGITDEGHTVHKLPAPAWQGEHPRGESAQESPCFKAHQANNLLFGIMATVEALEAKYQSLLANDPLFDNLRIASRKMQSLLNEVLHEARVQGRDAVIGPIARADAGCGVLEAPETGSQ